MIIQAKASKAIYIGNNDTKVFHKAACRMVRRMLEENKIYLLKRGDAKLLGYKACGICCP